MAKKETRKNKAEKPDEAWSAGPLHVARFGSNLLMHTDLSQADIDKLQAELVAKYPEQVATIDRLVGDIAAMVANLPADALMQRGWWQLANHQTKISAESDVGFDESLALRMVDYVQSVIASVTSQANAKKELVDEDYEALTKKVEELFLHINHHYQVCATAKERSENKDFDLDFEEFRFKAQIYWANVRGDRYQVHEAIYLREMFTPHSDVLEELFGVTAEDFVRDLSRLVEHFAHGINDLIGDAVSFQKDVLAEMEKRLEIEGDAVEDFSALMALVIEEKGWKERGRTALGNLIGMDFFDVEKNTQLPRALLDELAWGPGEETDFFAPGQFRGWPLRVWPVFRRPFLRLNGRIYCFDHYSLYDNIYRVMQRAVERLKPDYKQRWNQIQCQTTEDLPFGYLARILPGATIVRPIYYPVDKPDGTKNWAEADGALIYDDHMFVVEVKGGAFTQAPPSTDFPKYIRSLEKLLLDPAAQGRRFLDYLRSADSVPIYDKEHVQVGILRHKDYRSITICAVTLDPLTELAAQVQHLRKVGVDVGTEPVWACSINDLRAYADIFDNPLTFLHFVDQRIVASKSDVIRLEDELDHLGMYLKHNHYSTYAKELRGDSNARMTFGSYRDEIDRFFAARLLDPSTPCFLKQKTPARFSEIIEVLSISNGAGRARVAGALLDWDDAWRTNIANAVDFELSQQPANKRAKPAVIGHRKLGAQIVYCWGPSVSRNAADALEHAKSVIILQGDQTGLLLELTYDVALKLQTVNWTWLDAASISVEERERLADRVERLRLARLANAASDSKVGRNDPCPCGSGKKHKKCCLSR
jgi:hypothetical protein